jgi:hypothetical protein
MHSLCYTSYYTLYKVDFMSKNIFYIKIVRSKKIHEYVQYLKLDTIVESTSWHTKFKI